MPDALPLINRIAASWSDLVTKAVIEAVTDNPDADYYVAGFWLLYVDYTLFGVPCFALNTEENLAASDSSYRWSPPEWLVDVHPCYESIQSLYTELSELLDGASNDVWDTAIDQHHDAMCELCRKLTFEYHSRDGAFGTIRKNLQFVFGIFEERETEEVYEALLSGSIEPERRTELEGL